MSNPNFDVLATTTLKNYQRQFADNVSNHIPFFKWMKTKGAMKLQGGETIVEPIIHAFNTTAASYSRLDVLDTTEQQGITAAEYNWRQVSTQVTINGLERTLNGGKEKVLSLLEGKLEQAQMSMEDAVSVMLMGDGTGNTGKDLLGLEAIISQTPTVGTLGGIDASTNAYWRNQATTTVGSFAANGLTQMSIMMRNLTRGNNKPDLIITDSTNFGRLETVANGRAEFQNPSLADQGFQALKFQGVDVIFDNNITADRMYFVNSRHLKLKIHQDKNFSMGKFIEPANQDGVVAKILLYAQLTTNRREALGVLSGFTA